MGFLTFKMPRLKRLLPPGRLAGLAAIIVFAALRFFDAAPLEVARNYFFDVYQRAHPRPVQNLPRHHRRYRREKLDRHRPMALAENGARQTLSRLSEDGAVVTGFDMIFPEQDRLSPRRLIDLFPSADDAIKQKLAAMADNDELFAAAIRQARVVLGRAATRAATDAPAVRPKQRPKLSIATIGGDPTADLHHVAAAVKNLPGLDAAATGIGMLTVLPERDGVIRRAPLLLSVGTAIEPGLAIELLRVASGASSLVVKSDSAGVKSVAVAGVEIPTDSDGQLWVSFAPHGERRYVSAAAVLAGEVPRDRLEGKLAIIGTSAAGLLDLKSTPLDRVIPGVEVHAQIIESILDGTTLNRPNYALGVEIVLAAAIGGVLVIAAPLIGALGNLLIGAAMAALLAGISWYLFVAHRMLIDVSYPLASSFAVFLLMTFLNYLREEKRRGQVRAAFRQYLSPDLVEQLIREPSRLVLGGETRQMSILFSDVRRFTTIAESFKENPAALTALMNRMLTSLSHPILDRRGTIDKYIGDAIMAFWNAPLDDPGHAEHACEAALGILASLDELNAKRRSEALEAGCAVLDMEIGIGIATGAGVVGNMGSDIRFDYSVLGDTVNLASRLETLTATYGLRILIAAETARRCAGKLAIVEANRVRVKGKREAETVFALLGGQDLAQADDFRAFQAAFQAMLRAYRAKDWPQALAHLDRCRELNRTRRLGRLVDLYASRIAAFVQTPPPPDWDGVYNAHSPAA